MKEFIYYSNLYDIYSFLFTDKQKEIFSLYFEENLSLSEIAEYKKVSKSYVGKIITNAKQKLDYYEKNLQHLKLLEKLKEYETNVS